ncbi:MAG: signal peptidase II [Elusimicrobiota bacterium]|jgi:signal peptidase II|nr:signal peptidase II [Elusimicrobiota bacterium]
MKKYFSLFLSVLALDQISKLAIYKLLPYGASIQIVKPLHFFYLTKVYNTGGAFSFFQNHNLFFLIFIPLFLLSIALYAYKERENLSKFQKHCLCILIAGGAGNLTDRIFRGAVIDFLDFGINNLRWPSFNIADSAVCISVFLLAIDMLKTALKDKKNSSK